MFEIIDLTKVLDANTSIYAKDGYSDPPLQIQAWCTIQEQGFEVSRLCMGTQTGTHIDAPAHFIPGGATLDTLPLQALIGRYLLVNIDQLTQNRLNELQSNSPSPSVLFLTSLTQTRSEISEEVFRALLKLPCLVWVVVSGIKVAESESSYFHKALAEAGKYLIEDLDEEMAMRVHTDGEMIALPLRLSGTSGSPCRVTVRQSVK